MQVLYKEPAQYEEGCEVRIGPSSWDPNETSVKHTWFTAAGFAARGGEVPMIALPQMLDVAIQHGGLAPRSQGDEYIRNLHLSQRLRKAQESLEAVQKLLYALEARVDALEKNR